MAVQQVTLTVGDTAYDVGTVEMLDSDDAQRAKLERFLRAVADSLKDGYALRKAPAVGGPAELADLPVEVRQLVRAVDAMRDGWAEAALPGHRASERQQELWRAVHEASDSVWNRKDRG